MEPPHDIDRSFSVKNELLRLAGLFDRFDGLAIHKVFKISRKSVLCWEHTHSSTFGDKRMKKNLILLVLAALLSYPIVHSYAQGDLTNSAGLSFARNFPREEATRSLEESGIVINITVDSQLAYRGNVILFTESSARYAERDSSTTVKSTVSNAISSFELSTEANTSIDYGIGTMDVPTYTLHLQHAVLESMGSSQEIVMGEYVLFSGHLPFFGVQVSIFMRPVLTYIPTLTGSIATEGPASVSPDSLSWVQETVTCLVQFSGSEPTGLFLSNPTLILHDFSLTLEFYAILNTDPVYTPAVNVVGFGDYSMSSPDVNLLSFELDYYALYSELQESYADLASTLQNTQGSLDELTDEVGLLRDEIGLLAPQLQNLISRVDNLEKENPLSSNLTALGNQVETLSANWDHLADSLNQLTDEVDTLTVEVNAVNQRLEQSEQSTIVAIAFVASLVSLVIGSTSLWKAFNNK